MGRKNAKHKPAMAVTWFAGIGPLLSVRHAELVSASMVCPPALRGVCRKVRPWMLKQVQDDEGWISRGMVKRRHRLATTGVASMHEPQSLGRSEEHTSELQSLMRISYAVFCLKKKKHNTTMR